MKKTFEVTALVTDESTVVEVAGTTLNGASPLVAKGYSKKHPKDNPNGNVGYSLAVARALRELAQHYENYAETSAALNNRRLASGAPVLQAIDFGGYDTPNTFSGSGY